MGLWFGFRSCRGSGDLVLGGGGLFIWLIHWYDSYEYNRYMIGICFVIGMIYDSYDVG